MRELYHPPREKLDLPTVLHALSDPTRLSIVRQLAQTEELCVGSCDATVAKSTMSHHLKTLREAGVTRTRLEGTQRFLCVRRDDLDARFPGFLDALLKAAEQSDPAN
ncbi:MAG TPA: metalloregulator ArsR/SmtB family transcription factor [Gallionellaceae bacterium]|nr:metalloregulator ArsR/SmtB family transcription factor [Gallionellaceae bacterium]